MNDMIPKRRIIVYGDDDDQTVSKAIWSFLSGQFTVLENPDDIENLKKIANEALLILVVVKEEADSKRQDITELLGAINSNPYVLSDVVAVTNGASIERRRVMMAQGFDAIFDLSFMDTPDFKTILFNRIEKAAIRIRNREQEIEYKRFKSALDCAPDAFAVFDENQKLFFISEHYRNTYPHSVDKWQPGTPLIDVYERLAVEEGVARDDPRYEPMKKFWQTMDGEAEFPLSDGRIWRLQASPLPEGRGSIVITTDVTKYNEQKRLLESQSQELENALNEAREANNLQKQFINMVSHEFRTPLTIIDGNVQIIRKKAGSLDKEALEKRCQTIRSAIVRLVYTMEGVLSSSMLMSGKFDIIREVFDIKALFHELCDEYADLAQSVAIETDFDSLPDTVKMDRKVITLVVSNLLSNAVKFSKDTPQIMMRSWVERSPEVLVIEISDEGIGIPENEQEHIFKRYYRASTSSGIAGTGIGLHLAYDLIELHGGSIGLESKTGKGTKFIVKIPLDEA